MHEIVKAEDQHAEAPRTSSDRIGTILGDPALVGHWKKHAIGIPVCAKGCAPSASSRQGQSVVRASFG